MQNKPNKIKCNAVRQHARVFCSYSQLRDNLLFIAICKKKFISEAVVVNLYLTVFTRLSPFLAEYPLSKWCLNLTSPAQYKRVNSVTMLCFKIYFSY